MSDLIALALIRRLYAAGALDMDDLSEMAEEIDGESEERQLAAHRLRMVPIEATAPSQSQWEADRARERFHVVRPDGGNPER